MTVDSTPSGARVRIATRKSPLALWQARHVGAALREAGCAVELVELSTRGDKILDQALSKVGGKDLFVKEVEQALLDGRAEVAVHSLKDMPTESPEGLCLAVYPLRADPRDAIVSNKGYTLDTLPFAARVGTCSLRRAAQLCRLRPDLQICEIRGNVQTRLKRMEAENMDATVLAYAGLSRLGLTALATDVLGPDRCLPAIGQGILGVQARTEDAPTRQRLAALEHAPTRVAAEAERAFLHRLEGGCQVPIAGHATVRGDRVSLKGLVASLDGREVFEGEEEAPTAEAAALGVRLAERLLSQGADRVLAALMG